MDGLLVVQTRHTTTGLLINEHEPLLLEDLEALFERLAPASAGLRTRRLQPPHGEPDAGRTSERPRALPRRASENLGVCAGRRRPLSLGRWQRVFLVDFDGGQRREVSLTVMGTGTGL